MNHQPSTISHEPSIFFLVGPTATGKSALALELAEMWNADILSADSRQIYQGLEITSGADIPAAFSHDTSQTIPCFVNPTQTRLFGISMRAPTDEWSIAHFRALTFQVIQHCTNMKKNLIIVGGAGLYVQSLFLSDPQITTSPNESVRLELENIPLQELQTRLQTLAPDHAKMMNHSDWHNPRRLIRAIEIFSQPLQKLSTTALPHLNRDDTLWIGMHTDKDTLATRIAQRVDQRLHDGAIQEIERLCALLPPTAPILSTLGCKDIIAYLDQRCSRDELRALWTRHELQYAKRQITWFKKHSQIKWYELGTTATQIALANHLNSR